MGGEIKIQIISTVIWQIPEQIKIFFITNIEGDYQIASKYDYTTLWEIAIYVFIFRKYKVFLKIQKLVDIFIKKKILICSGLCQSIPFINLKLKTLKK